MAKPRVSEVDAYVFIKEDLKNLGWNPKNPSRTKEAQGIYTQGECLDEPRIAEQLGQTKPENIVKVSETDFYVIEAKASRSQIDLAVSEAQDYANNINRSKHISAKIISGIAGNDADGYLVKSRILLNGKYKPIISNDKELTSLISPFLAKHLLDNKTNIIKELPIDAELFSKAATRINEILHNGAIPATERGKVMSALLLSLVDDTQPNVNAKPRILIQEINARVNSVLTREGKPEFYDYVKISLPTTETNHVKFKNALVKTIQELNNLNIRSAMNSGTDILGNFYEVFLKYGNWAKEIGIVLTPRHITPFAAEVLDVNHKDIIFDPTCGTAGFLVSAFDYVKKNSTDAQVANFKQNNIFGIEQEASVVALAIVNMIFRGDGKNNIQEANCLHQWLNQKRKDGVNTAEYLEEDSKDRISPVTKVLMNPPFALKEDADKEYRFVNHALNQMQKGGILFAILPTSEMLGKGQYREWRNSLLESNTLLSVITFPPDLFYPIAVVTCAIIVKRGIPHPREQNVFWIRAIHDGLVKRKGQRRKPKSPLVERDILSEYKEDVKKFIKNQKTKIKNVPELCKLSPIDFDDSSLELVPEAYLDEKSLAVDEIRNGIDELVRTTAGYLITISEESVKILKNGKTVKTSKKMMPRDLVELCTVERKYAPYMNEILSDQKITPYVTTTETSNGISIRCDTEPNFPKDTVSVSLDGLCGTTFYQFEDYIAGEKTAVLQVRDELKIEEELKPYLLFYIAYLIRRKAWRYHYGRKLSEERLKKFSIPLPVVRGG
jgi:type I restriction enzyme M protein